MTESGRRPRRVLSLRAKLLLAAASPVVFLLLLELGLAVAGYAARQEWAPYDRFRARKPAGTVRIAVVGGSAAAGCPFEHRGGPVAFLRQLLRDVAPGQPTEVVNCAVNALASGGILLLLDKIVERDIDVLIVYSGHNEFYNEPSVNHAVATWEPDELSWYRKTRAYSLLQDMALQK